MVHGMEIKMLRMKVVGLLAKQCITPGETIKGIWTYIIISSKEKGL